MPPFPASVSPPSETSKPYEWLLTQHHSIYSPPDPSSAVVVWLPSALPQLLNSHDDNSSHHHFYPATLSRAISATVIQINYRLSRQFYYPTPIHDVLAGYQWIVKHIVPKLSQSLNTPYTRRSNGKVRLHVCGELVGGSLASMLALTECQLGRTGINTAFVSNPICDWVSMQESDTKLQHIVNASEDTMSPRPALRQSHRRKGGPVVPSLALFASNACLPSSSLFTARSSLFKDPSSYFDPFASPSLFFRTPGASPSVSHESDESSPSSRPDDHVEDKVTLTARKAYLKYPPSHLALRLPPFRIEMGAQNPLRDQVEEFANLLSRSHRIARPNSEKAVKGGDYQRQDHGTRQVGKNPTMESSQSFAGSPVYPTMQPLDLTGMVQLRVKNGIGLWDRCAEEEKMETVLRISQWLKDMSPDVQ